MENVNKSWYSRGSQHTITVYREERPKLKGDIEISLDEFPTTFSEQETMREYKRNHTIVNRNI